MLSDLLANIATSTGLGYGPLQISLGPLESVLKGKLSSMLGSKDAELEKKVELSIADIQETAAYAYTGRFLFGATLGVESKKIFNSLEGRDLQPTSETVLKRNGHILELIRTKDETLEDVRKRLCKEPEETPRKIIEQEFRVSEVSLIYLPVYDLTLEFKGKTKTTRLDGVTGEMKELS